MISQTILVVGGGGMLGEPVARKLRAAGHHVRLLARDPGKLAEKFGADFEVVQGDVENGRSVSAALEGCDGVHVNLMGGPHPDDFDRIEHRGTATVATSAAAAEIKRLTYLSGAPAQAENERDAGCKAKLAAEKAIVASGVPYTIFKATWMTEYCNKVRPDVKLTFLPPGLMSIVAKLSFDKSLQADVRRMAFYDTIGDQYGDGAEADRLLGPATTTVAEWCTAQTAG